MSDVIASEVQVEALCLPEERPSSLRLLQFLSSTLTSALLETLAIAPNGGRRYNELLRLLAPTPKRALTGALRRLERVGVVERQAFPEVPVRVEYWVICGNGNYVTLADNIVRSLQ